MATASEIDTYHQRLVSALNSQNILGQKAALRAERDVDWKSDKFEGKVGFELYPKDVRLIGASERRRDMPLFAFEKIRIVGRELEEIDEGISGARCWVGWSEQWERFAPSGIHPGKKGIKPYFMLGAIQWILFWGHVNDDSKVQVMRAEWDNAAHLAPHRKPAKGADATDEEDATAAQPHWHIDPPLEIGDVSAIELFRGTSLEEEAGHAFSGKYLRLKRVHLAMGGWKFPQPGPKVGAPAAKGGSPAATNSNACWQIDYTEDKERLIEWNLNVVRYIKSQINYIIER